MNSLESLAATNSIRRDVNEPGQARARPGSSSAQFKPTYLSSSSSSARAILRTTSNKLKAWLELASISFKRAKARLEPGSPMLSSLLLLLYYILNKNKILFGLI
ncbi:hypothetical protein HanXRQr2_Chr17g0820561 [Helianthus annuus]|uniref:Uncharacterized protein n=1 Tax=Helianthus annuus TaxID=4232 RepID=A0A9K3DKB5_HELAN|nr:hypothetical protein HanXRQr2_Chr17g0820561 [Helianthus annuus]